MKFRFNQYDDNGIPTHVTTWDGFVEISRKFEMEEDEWMLEQLNPNDFEAVRNGVAIEEMIIELNHLRRENFDMKKRLARNDKLLVF